MQMSCKSEEVANVVHSVIESLQDQLSSDRVINPVLDLQTIEAQLKAALSQLQETYWAELMVPAHVDIEAQDAEQFKTLQCEPLRHAKIKAVGCGTGQDTIVVGSEHVDSVLENSGFNRASDEFNHAIKSDKPLTSELILKPILALAEYFASASTNGIIISPPAVNVYDASQTTVAHTQGLNSHAAQKVKIRFDPTYNIIHVPRHCLDDLVDSPGILAKIGLQVVNAHASIKRDYTEYSNIPDPGEFLKVMHILLNQEKTTSKIQKLKALIKSDHTAVEVISPSDELARQVFASMVGASDQYHLTLEGQRPYFHARGAYLGPQTPSETNHWHTYGDRALAKSIMADPAQSENAREAAALAYRAGVVARRAVEPFSAVQREFALRANARAMNAANV
jgi:hypothetical protein